MTTVSDFRTRLAVGEMHEQRVSRELRARGWTIDHYGQGVLSQATRDALGRSESRLRWDPDFVASSGSRVCLIDAKSSMRGTDAHMYNVSRKALRAHLRAWVELELPVYYVFPNLGVATPSEVLEFAGLATLGDAGGYVYFPSHKARPLDEVFGGPVYTTVALPLGVARLSGVDRKRAAA